MRLIKLALISFILLFVLITLISLLIPSQIRISRATNLPNERQAILSLLQNDSSWHPAYQDSASSGNMALLDRKVLEQTDSTLVVQLQQKSRKPVVNGWQIYGAPGSDSLALQWYMDFRLAWYPWEKFSSLFFERTYGTMMEQGLANLKKQLMEE